MPSFNLKNDFQDTAQAQQLEYLAAIIRQKIKETKNYHVIRGVGTPPITQESVTASSNPMTMLLSASRTVGGSDADSLEIFRYGVFRDASPGPASLTADTRKVYSLSVIKLVNLYVVSIIVSVILLHLEIKSFFLLQIK